MPNFLLVDFKLDSHGNLHILEFGCGINSSFKGYDACHLDSGVPLSLYQKILHFLGKKYTHVYLLSKKISDSLSEFVIDLNKTKINGHFELIAAGCSGKWGFDSFVDLNEYVGSTESEIFKQLTEQDCFIVIDEDAYECFIFAAQLHTYFTKHDIKAQVINSNPSISAMVQNKFVFSIFDRKNPLKSTLWDITRTIQEQLDSLECHELMALKPVDENGGMGVLIVHHHELPAVLTLIHFAYQLKRLLFKPRCYIAPNDYIDQIIAKSEELNIRLQRDELCTERGIYYWLKWRSLLQNSPQSLLIQAYAAGNPLATQGYDATGRMVFFYDESTHTIQCIDGYWKFPKQRQSSEASASDINVSEETHISDLTNLSHSSARLTREEFEHIEFTLQQIVPPILHEATQTRLVDFLESLRQSTSEIFKLYAERLAQQFLPLIQTEQTPSTLSCSRDTFFSTAAVETTQKYIKNDNERVSFNLG